MHGKKACHQVFMIGSRENNRNVNNRSLFVNDFCLSLCYTQAINKRRTPRSRVGYKSETGGETDERRITIK